MKKVLFSIMIALSVFSAKAQLRTIGTVHPAQSSSNLSLNNYRGDGDTLTLNNIMDPYNDSLVYYNWQSPNWGSVVGHNSYGDRGWAERFDISGTDSSVTIIGMIFFSAGTVSPNSTGVLHARIYSAGAKAAISGGGGNRHVTGYPAASLGEAQVPYLNLNDTINVVPMLPPVQIADTFFAAAVLDAYDPATTLDSVRIPVSKDGSRAATDVLAVTMPTDTTINVRNAALWSDNTWNDEATANTGLLIHYCVFPIVVVKYANIGVQQGITRGALSFQGNYPNPANTTTNIRIGLKKAADVKVKVYDVTGKVVLSHTFANVSTGANELPLNVETLDAGNYIYSVEADGAIIGSMLQVVK